MRVYRRPRRTILAGVCALGLSVAFIVVSSLLRSPDSKPEAAVKATSRVQPAPTLAAKPTPKPSVATKPKPNPIAKTKPKPKPKPKPIAKAKPTPKPVVKAKPTPAPKPKPKQATKPKPTPVGPPTLPPFAWSPVAGASAYDFQLFRGAKLVYEKRTTQPAVTVPTTWTSRGKLVRLTPGSYRWYVWAIVGGARSEKAVVQAKLQLPG